MGVMDMLIGNTKQHKTDGGVGTATGNTYFSNQRINIRIYWGSRSSNSVHSHNMSGTFRELD